MQSYDEKNIRRRVYDALNVLLAMDMVTRGQGQGEGKAEGMGRVQFHGTLCVALNQTLNELTSHPVPLE